MLHPAALACNKAALAQRCLPDTACFPCKSALSSWYVKREVKVRKGLRWATQRTFEKMYMRHAGFRTWTIKVADPLFLAFPPMPACGEKPQSSAHACHQSSSFFLFSSCRATALLCCSVPMQVLCGVSMERYIVYSSLSRSGYLVMR